MNLSSYAMNTTLRAIKSLSIAVRSKLLSPIQRTGIEYDSEDHANNDIADLNTDTTTEDIRRDVNVIAPKLFTGAVTPKK
jgi:hypothetical protein